MTCDELRQLRAAYGAGELPEGTAALVEGHASRCAECEAALLESLELPDRWEEELRGGIAPWPRSDLADRARGVLAPQGAGSDVCYLLSPHVWTHHDYDDSEDASAEVEAHLTACPTCARSAEWASWLDARVWELRVEPHRRLEARLTRLLNRYGERAPAKPRSWQPAVWLTAAGAAALVLVVGVRNHMPTSPPVTVVANTATASPGTPGVAGLPEKAGSAAIISASPAQPKAGAQPGGTAPVVEASQLRSAPRSAPRLNRVGHSREPAGGPTVIATAMVAAAPGRASAEGGRGSAVGPEGEASSLSGKAWALVTTGGRESSGTPVAEEARIVEASTVAVPATREGDPSELDVAVDPY
jgi:hypothetical protein